MATAPFQLWIDGPPIASAIRSASTVTITTLSAHGITSGAYVQVEGCIGTAGTSMNGVFQITTTSGTTFTYTAAGSAGTAVTTATLTTEAFGYDILNPLVNYAAGTARDQALYVPLESLQMSASGDGEAATISFSVIQDDTPGSTPWFLTIPDQTRIRLIKANTGSAPAAGQTFFRGFLQNISSQILRSGQGTITDVSGVDVNALLDRVVIHGEVR